MTTVVILQPQYFPWVGVFEQISICDVYVHLDHVQLPQGRSFCTRVQTKSAEGATWLSVPVARNQGQSIKDTQIVEEKSWRNSHMSRFGSAVRGLPFARDALEIMEAAFASGGTSLCDLNIAGIELMARYIGLKAKFARSSSMRPQGKKDDMLISLLAPLQADEYVTGRGALNYLDHEGFARSGVEVTYVDYVSRPYPQNFEPFDPYVSFLHAIAALGRSAIDLLEGRRVHWQDMKSREARDESERHSNEAGGTGA